MKAGVWAFRIGAVFYVLWGLLHLYAAWASFDLGRHSTDLFVGAKLQQNGWNLAFIAVLCIAIAVSMNWRNSRRGYWANLVLVSATDLGFVVLILLPGIAHELLGPILWVLALIFTTIGYLAAERTP